MFVMSLIQTGFMNTTSYNDHQQTQAETLAATAWHFAHCLLWNALEFSAEEERRAQEQIHALLTARGDVRKAFQAFCQRVLLAQQYVSRREDSYLPLPTQWLNPGNEQGFAGTRNWLRRIETARASLPCHRQELKAMAEAVLEMHEDPSRDNYHYWRSYFIQAGEPRLLELFQQCIAHLQWGQGFLFTN
jgi:hypothetical protein